MTLADFGYNETVDTHVAEKNAEGFQIGRIVSEQKERYSVFTAKGEFEAEITGAMRFSARGREDFPATGDWVLLTLYDNDFAIIHAILPRYSLIKRRAIDQHGEIQVIAANIDYAIIVQAADRDFNLNRIERYLTICNDSGIQSIIVITKIDLYEESKIEEIRRGILGRVKNTPVIFLSNETLSGLDVLKESILKGKTYCLLGSSGVGKSSIINNLSEKEVMKTGEISSLTNKGRHVTSYRELVVLENGGILIDNPGMREVGIADNESGLEKTFDTIAELSDACRFSDCTHTLEAGCAVLDAVRTGGLDRKIYDNYLKMEKEREFFASTKAESHRKDKDFGKMLKNYQKDKKLNKF